MTDRQPTETRNLDRYGKSPVALGQGPRPSGDGRQGAVAGFFLATTNPDGRPQVTGVGVVWHDGDLYFSSGHGTRKSRNLKANPACAMPVNLPGMDLTLDGEVANVTDPATLEKVAGLYQELGWPAG